MYMFVLTIVNDILTNIPKSTLCICAIIFYMRDF